MTDTPSPGSQHRAALRGYTGVRMAMGRSVPQSVQQLVMREYCAARGLTYLLAATEYCMPGSTMMISTVLDEIESVDGVLLYSLFLLPDRRDERVKLYGRVIDSGRGLHMAVERLVVRTWEDAGRVEDVWRVLDVVQAQAGEDLQRLTRWDSEHAGNQFS